MYETFPHLYPKKSYNNYMPKDIVTVQIKRIPLEYENSTLGVLELTDLAANVEKYMLELQADGEIDTLKQALRAAMHFAETAYLTAQNEGGKRKEEENRLDTLISKVKTALDTSK
jgi:hypothetical protein